MIIPQIFPGANPAAQIPWPKSHRPTLSREPRRSFLAQIPPRKSHGSNPTAQRCRANPADLSWRKSRRANPTAQRCRANPADLSWRKSRRAREIDKHEEGHTVDVVLDVVISGGGVIVEVEVVVNF